MIMRVNVSLLWQAMDFRWVKKQHTIPHRAAGLSAKLSVVLARLVLLWLGRILGSPTLMRFLPALGLLLERLLRESEIGKTSSYLALSTWKIHLLVMQKASS